MNEISLHILDIVQNSIVAGAAHIFLEVVEDFKTDLMTITVSDDGCGMDEDAAQKAQSPFATSRKTRKVGLGIPMFKEGCLACGGQFGIQSAPGKGTSVWGSYRLSHIDRPPLGNLADTVYLLVAANPDLDFTYRHQVNEAVGEFETTEIRQALGDDVPIDNSDVLQWVRQYLNETEQNLRGGADQS